MHAKARQWFDELGISIDDLQRSVRTLSGGQRQAIALARAVLEQPRLLILDEPTAALGVSETRAVERLIRQLRTSGTAILLVSQRIEQVFDLADRIIVLRKGRVVTEVSPLEVHPDDVVAAMSGIQAESTARRQLHRLRSLVDQLSETAPSASLPLIVSAMAEALGQDQLCVHLLDHSGERPLLRRSAALGVREPLLAVNAELPVGPDGGSIGLAAANGALVVVEDVRSHPVWTRFLDAAGAAEILSTWAAPIVGSRGVLGTISGYADTVGKPQSDQLELVSLYASYAAAAIEREQLLNEATRRNRILETLRGMLEILAGPEQVHQGLDVALLALCRGLAADAAMLYSMRGDEPHCCASIDLSEDPRAAKCAREAATVVLTTPARLVGETVVAVPITLPTEQAALSAYWSTPGRIRSDALELLDDAARSLCLAIERESLLAAQQEAKALRRSQDLQREFLSRLSHELRTPLTAIHGYASTLRQPDVTWDTASQHRFLDSIVTESSRLGRLVADLLDVSAMESGMFCLHSDWCELDLVIDAAVACVPRDSHTVEVHCEPDVGPVWGDHDRLEQVLVNLIDNAVRHTPAGTRVLVSAAQGSEPLTVKMRVSDDGPGLPPALAGQIFQPYARGTTVVPGAGLGLSIAHGIVEAHGGHIMLEPVPIGTSFLVTLPVEPAPGESDDGR
jgi:signal transduction histidine kinase